MNYDHNMLLVNDLLRSVVATNNGFIRLKRDSIVLTKQDPTITMHSIIDNRILNTDDMNATLEFDTFFNFIVSKEDKRSCAIELKTPEEATNLAITINLINWHGAFPMMNVTTPIVITDKIPVFNLTSGGVIYFQLTVTGVDNHDAVKVDIDFWVHHHPEEVKRPEPQPEEDQNNESQETTEEVGREVNEDPPLIRGKTNPVCCFAPEDEEVDLPSDSEESVCATLETADRPE